METTAQQRTKPAPGSKVRHVAYGWAGFVVEGPRAATCADSPSIVEVNWENGLGKQPSIVSIDRLEVVATPDGLPPDGRFYLVVTGDIETAPGRFERGVVHSSSHLSEGEARAEWNRMIGDGLYEDPFETYEVRHVPLTLDQVLAS